MTKSTPKNFILQLGALIALYVSVTSLLVLVFSVTNLKFPDEATNYWADDSARDAVRNSIAMLLVFYPTFLIFTRLSNQDRRSFNQGEYTTFAKWLVYISILGGILVILGDLVMLINYFLNGEITSRFVIKVAALLLIVGGALSYYILDVRNYFKKNIKRSVYFGIVASVVVVSALLLGYSYIETPDEVRQIRLDEQQVTDLQDIYWTVNQYFLVNEELPATVTDAYIQSPVPSAPDNRDAYSFEVLDENTIKLCATFSTPSTRSGRGAIKTVSLSPDDMFYEKNQNWEHVAGESCFTRTFKIDES